MSDLGHPVGSGPETAKPETSSNGYSIGFVNTGYNSGDYASWECAAYNGYIDPVVVPYSVGWRKRSPYFS